MKKSSEANDKHKKLKLNDFGDPLVVVSGFSVVPAGVDELDCVLVTETVEVDAEISFVVFVDFVELIGSLVELISGLLELTLFVVVASVAGFWTVVSVAETSAVVAAGVVVAGGAVVSGTVVRAWVVGSGAGVVVSGIVVAGAAIAVN